MTHFVRLLIARHAAHSVDVRVARIVDSGLDHLIQGHAVGRRYAVVAGVHLENKG